MVPGAARIVYAAASALEPRLMEKPAGSNDGPELREFLRRTDFQPGERWCMYFAVACVLESLGVMPEGTINTGSCELAARYAKKHGQLSPYAATGAIFVVPDRRGHFFHAGIVREVRSATATTPKSLVHTIEGNTNSNGSSNGIGVFEHIRPESSLRYIIW